MQKLKKDRRVFRNPLVKHKNPKLLKKLGLAITITVFAAVLYSMISGHTFEAHQQLKLQKTFTQLQQTKHDLEKLKTNSSEQDKAKQQQIEQLNKQLQDTQSQLQAKRNASSQAVAYAAAAPDPVDNGWHYDCRSQTDAVYAEVARQGLGDQWQYIKYIFDHESCEDPGRLNSIGARGLGQSLGHDSFTCGAGNIACQVTWFNTYAQGRGGWYTCYLYWLSHGNW